LLPGVGLGRLLYEFAKLGYNAQGNEFSYFMLLSSNFILNCTTKKDEYEILPLIHSFSNVFWEEAPFKPVLVPDENLMEELSKSDGEMSMVAGEFVEVYKDQPEAWNSIVTCYFIDTANNIVQYIETIHKILKVGGLWINFGPLLYHYSEMEKECSIELSWDEVKYIIQNIGFELKKEEIKESSYSSDKNSMLKTIYRCIYFTAVKVK
jgi:carnosine N-methyltransferase